MSHYNEERRDSMLPVHNQDLPYKDQIESRHERHQQERHHHERRRQANGERPSKHRRFKAVPESFRNASIAFIGELVGTYLFLFMAFAGTQVAVSAPASNSDVPSGLNPPPEVTKLIYISFVFGISLTVNVWISFRVSGGMFNPAVTLALTLVRAVPPLRAIVCIIAQLLGAMAAAGMVEVLLPNPSAVSTLLQPQTSLTRGLFIEVFLTAQLVLTILMLAVEKHAATPFAPLGIGLSLFIAELAGVYYTGGSLNPARSFGPAVIEGFPGYHWIYWAGPCIGAVLATGVYALLKWAGYETANPGQDHAGRHDYVGAM